MLKLLYRTCKDISEVNTKKLSYVAWVRSLLEYASVLWSPCTRRNISSLEKVQRSATRFILGQDYSEYERISKLNIRPLQYRREKRPHLSLEVPKDISKYISFCSCCKALRNVDHVTLAIPFSKTEAFKNSYSVYLKRV